MVQEICSKMRAEDFYHTLDNYSGSYNDFVNTLDEYVELIQALTNDSKTMYPSNMFAKVSKELVEAWREASIKALRDLINECTHKMIKTMLRKRYVDEQ